MPFLSRHTNHNNIHAKNCHGCSDIVGTLEKYLMVVPRDQISNYSSRGPNIWRQAGNRTLVGKSVWSRQREVYKCDKRNN